MAATAVVSLLLLACLSLSLTASSAPSSEATTAGEAELKGIELIKKVCRNSLNYTLCVSSMSSDPRTADAGLFLLTNISIDHALANASDTYAAVKKMYDAATEPKLKACLLSCETEYYLAVYHLQSAIQYLAEKNYFDGISALQAAFDDVTTCEDAFNEPRFQPVKSPLIQKNQIAKYLCNISFEFERLLGPSS